jgi:hypothetical protein
MPVTGLDLIVKRTDLSDAEIVQTEFPDIPPEGSCLLRVDHFALTANNITYGVAADMLGYWDFFPAAREGYGRIPVWGFAEVVASSHPEVAAGERVYGYLPMSTHVMVEPGKVNAGGFMDMAAHRAERAPIYNQYVLTRSDPMWQAGKEAEIALFRPLFTTSFLLADMHDNAGYFGAQNVILSSASSKTSIGLAQVLSATKPEGVRVVGLTSAGNLAFVEGLGCYDKVVAYDALGDLPEGDSVFVDMAGNSDLRRSVHETLGERLKNSTAVGMTHWQESSGLGGDLPGPKPTFFFAPAYAQKRLEEWGREGFQQRLGAAWSGFAEAAGDWFDVETAKGPEAVMAEYLKMLSGKISPQKGLMLTMQAAD